MRVHTSRKIKFAALLGAASLLALLAAAPANAAPSWGIGITHTNLYGAGGHGPGDLVSPYDGRNDTFARDSGGNGYSIQVTNTALAIGTALMCEAGAWSEVTGFEYQWYRNGTPIASATTNSYTTTAADDGKAVQCAVTGTNAGPGKFTAYTVPRLVGSAGAAGLPRRGEELSLSASSGGNTGSVLTCNPKFGWRWPAFSYQWLKNGAPIAGVTGSTYTIQPADAPAAIQCVVAATNAAGTVLASSSAQLTATPPSPAAPSTSLATGPGIEGGTNVAGGSSVGQKLTCTGGPATATLSYQWLRNAAPIAGATASTYTLVAADQGTEVQCKVVATNSEAAASAQASAGTVVNASPAPTVAPPTAGTPTVTGTATAGANLTCANGTWLGNGIGFAYQWLSNGVNATGTGATTSTYTVAAADQGHDIQCQVTGTNSGGGAIGISANKLFSASVPSASVAPTITGTITVGSELTCNNGTWAPTTPPALVPTFSWEWLRNGTPIGVTTQKYTLAVADEGTVIQCRVTAANAQATAQAMSGNKVVPPPPGTTPPALTLAGSVSGTAEVGKELTCATGTWSGSPTFARQWLRNGVAISGATNEKYLLTLADLNKSIQCQVTATNLGGISVAINATSTSVKYVNPAAGPTAAATLSAPGTVSVSVALPTGMKLVAANSNLFIETTADDIGFEPKAAVAALGQINASGWNCDVATVTCTRATALAPGASYPPIVLHVNPGGAETPDLVAPVVTVFGGGAEPPSATASDPTEIAPAVPFGVRSFTAEVKDEANSPYSLAGGHPFSAQADIRLNGNLTPSRIMPAAGGDPHDVGTELPPGFSANVQNFPTCEAAVAASQFQQNGPECPLSTAVGVVEVSLAEGHVEEATGKYNIGYAPKETKPDSGRSSPLWNAEPGRGAPAALAFRINGLPFLLEGQLRSDGDYGISVVSKSTSRLVSLNGARVTICANGVIRQGGAYVCKSAPPNAAPFINNPSKCAGEAPLTTVKLDSWQRQGDYVEMGAYTGAPSGPYSYFEHSTTAAPVGSPGVPGGSYLTGCEALNELFHPTLSFQPTNTKGDSPTGADVDLEIPQTNRQDTPMTPALKKTVVELPSALSLNSAAGSGLGACTEDQIGLVGTGFAAPNPIHFDKGSIECPDSSKIGTLTAESPLLVERNFSGGPLLDEEGNKILKPLHGAVYLASQKANPFGSNFAIYLGIEDEQTGIVVKLPGKVEADSNTGQLTSTFDNNPQLPLEHFRLHFFSDSDSQAPLATSPICGRQTTRSEMAPWSAADPENPQPSEIATSEDSFTIDSNCADSESKLPFSLGLSGGSAKRVAGATTAFSMRMQRPDGAQELSTLSLSPPPGLTAYLKGVPYCSEAAIEAAKAKTGKAEQANPSCPSASEIGTATVGVGAGAHPYYTSGKLYLAGPYRGAPLSVVAITPAVAGPFDLGDVVVRSAVYVDPATLRITAKTDPLPHILEGVPLRVRDLRVNLSRSNWTLNPTNCNPMTIDAAATGTGGAMTNLSTRFQVGGCKDLAFHPKLAIQLHGGTKRGAFQRLQAVVTTKPGEANIARAAVTLPHSEFLAQEHIRTVCTRVQFAAESCPAGSIYGYAKATSPLVDYTVQGPVYLRSSNNLLPDLVADLRGPANQPIRVELDGRTDSVHGGIRNTFDLVPDAPVSKFTLSLKGGRKSLIVNSRNLCSGVQRATVRLTGQNGKTHNFRPVVENDCGKKGKK